MPSGKTFSILWSTVIYSNAGATYPADLLGASHEFSPSLLKVHLEIHLLFQKNVARTLLNLVINNIIAIYFWIIGGCGQVMVTGGHSNASLKTQAHYLFSFALHCFLQPMKLPRPLSFYLLLNVCLKCLLVLSFWTKPYWQVKVVY